MGSRSALEACLVCRGACQEEEGGRGRGAVLPDSLAVLASEGKESSEYAPRPLSSSRFEAGMHRRRWTDVKNCMATRTANPEAR